VDLTEKVAIFCCELDGNALQNAVRKQGKEELFQHAVDILKEGDIGPALEADLDALDAMVRQEDGQGLFLVTRSYSPLPPYSGDNGARWWTCPRGRCVGRGRVQPLQQPPMCTATSEYLRPGPLPE
jgi:hypothetical protein